MNRTGVWESVTRLRQTGMLSFPVRWLLLIATVAWFSGCGKPAGTNEVVVYVALDQGFSEPILKEYEKRTGVRVLPVYDTESTKSVGLRERLVREAKRPRCDVFWNNEILNTLALQRAGILAPYSSPVGNEYPQHCRSEDGLWYGFAARVRVLIVNNEKLGAESAPQTLEELTDSKWKGQIGIAKPLFGTTATHVACLFAKWGPEKTQDWLLRLKENQVQVLSGNKQVALAVGAGTLTMGLTDTDDALAEIHAGRPVKMVFLESAADQMGMLVIPNTVSVIRDAPHPEQAPKLVDYLLSPEVEDKLATGESGQLPLHPKTKAGPELGMPEGARLMEVNFNQAADQWDAAMQFVKEHFTQ